MGYGSAGRRMGSEPHAQNSAEMANVECSEGAGGGWKTVLACAQVWAAAAWPARPQLRLFF